MMVGKRVYVGESNRRILDGDEDVSDWDDEELWRGRKRDKGGAWRGAPPTLVPRSVHEELARRKFDEAGEVLRESVVDAVSLWGEIVRDVEVDLSLRLEASELIVKYTLGKPVDRSEVDVNLRRDPWQDALMNGIVGTDSDVIEAEVVEDPEDDEITWDDV